MCLFSTTSILRQGCVQRKLGGYDAAKYRTGKFGTADNLLIILAQLGEPGAVLACIPAGTATQDWIYWSINRHNADANGRRRQKIWIGARGK